MGEGLKPLQSNASRFRGVGGASLTSFQQEPDVLGIVDLHAVTAGQSVEQSGLS